MKKKDKSIAKIKYKYSKRKKIFLNMTKMIMNQNKI